MNPKFLNLEAEKRERIFNVAIDEFAKKGYRNASTNEIVKNAGISKGSLFHYFGSKKELLLSVYDYTIDHLRDEIYRILSNLGPDIIGRLREISLSKIELFRRNPGMYDFMMRIMSDDSPEIEQQLQSRNKSLMDEGYKRLFENLDTDVYKDGLDQKRVTEMIIWVIDGFGNRALEKLRNDPAYRAGFDMDNMMAELDTYLKLLKKVFYQS